ncbi:MAG: FAD-binding protein [Desulfobulbaceae bacterium]|uniref:FAD-binding protein n=1 Tax=Candidatus Desulfobia pelagia TaxID=2841692 RepID=A0A8J6ND28_9BACT|nr:FAD-binding protein [Candidatus Desulfobia pelagia]
MAYRVGAEITGKEYTDTHSTNQEHPAYQGFSTGMFGPPLPSRPGEERVMAGPPGGPNRNAEGKELIGVGTLWLDMEFEAHAGRAPIIGNRKGKQEERVGGASSGMSVHKAEGIWPGNTDCSTNMPGLYAAGDSLGNMQTGALYAAIGTSISSCAITGKRAGIAAALYASQMDLTQIDEGVIEDLVEEFLVPLKRKGGYSPRWVTQLLQNLMMPYFIMYIKNGDRLEATLTLVEFIRDHLVPKIFAKDPHELRQAHEVRNMVLNAEMRLRSSVYRTESRGCHYREDYPQRDDPDWLAWVVLKEENGKMITFKKPIPEEWWPNLSLPVEKRYPHAFPTDK